MTPDPGEGGPVEQNTVPEGLMHRLAFTSEEPDPDAVPPRIPPDLPLIFSPGDEA